jgi:hypothetical protein
VAIDAEVGLQLLLEVGGGHPAGRAALVERRKGRLKADAEVLEAP